MKGGEVMEIFAVSADQRNLMEKLYYADHVFTKADFDDPKKMVPFLSELRETGLIEWHDIGNWALTISEKGKAYYESYLEQMRQDAVGERRHQETSHHSKTQNKIAILALIVSALSMVISIVLPLLIHYLQK